MGGGGGAKDLETISTAIFSYLGLIGVRPGVCACGCVVYIEKYEWPCQIFIMLTALYPPWCSD